MSESTGGRPSNDHKLSIAMAKELCMLQRSAIGRDFRQYFIKVEENWNSPEAIMARALSIANQRLEMMKSQNLNLERMVAVQNQQISEMQPKVSYYDLVLNCKDLVSISVIAKDYGWSAKRMNNYLCEIMFSLNRARFGFYTRNMPKEDIPALRLLILLAMTVHITITFIPIGPRQEGYLSMTY